MEDFLLIISENTMQNIELFQKAIVEWNDKLTDVLENRSERNRWINHFMKFSTMEVLTAGSHAAYPKHTCNG